MGILCISICEEQHALIHVLLKRPQQPQVRVCLPGRKREEEMFITISTYLARAGEEDAIIAMHEDLQRNQLSRVKGDILGELLRSVENPHRFVAIMHYESQESAQALANDPEQQAWFQRLVSLTETVPVVNEYKSEWQVP